MNVHINVHTTSKCETSTEENNINKNNDILCKNVVLRRCLNVPNYASETTKLKNCLKTDSEEMTTKKVFTDAGHNEFSKSQLIYFKDRTSKQLINI